MLFNGIESSWSICIGADRFTFSEGNRIDSGVLSFSAKGNIVCKCGTSFSTPRISALMANLNHNLIGDFKELLKKTLAIHCARYPQEVNESIDDKLIQYDFFENPKPYRDDFFKISFWKMDHVTVGVMVV